MLRFERKLDDKSDHNRYCRENKGGSHCGAHFLGGFFGSGFGGCGRYGGLLASLGAFGQGPTFFKPHACKASATHMQQL